MINKSNLNFLNRVLSAKKINFIFILILFLIPIVFAGVIKIGVKMEVKGEISAFFHNSSNGFLKLEPEFFNTGSVAYKARARVEISNATHIIFTGWSNEQTLMPGERKVFVIYWYTPEKESITVNLRIYYGKEIIEREMKFKVDNTQMSEDIFQIKNFRTYDNVIKFQVRSNQSLKNVVVIPKNYMMSWIFEQTKIETLDANKNTEVNIPYEAEIWLPDEVTFFDIVSEDGKYYSNFSFKLQKETGLWKNINSLTDRLYLFFNL